MFAGHHAPDRRVVDGHAVRADGGRQRRQQTTAISTRFISAPYRLSAAARGAKTNGHSSAWAEGSPVTGVTL